MSQQTFNLKEIIEMAIHIERSGVAFYQRLKEQSGDREAKSLFKTLEAAEHQHIRDFEKVLKSALQKHGNLEYPTSSQELLYLRAFASRRIFQNPDDAAAKAASTSTAVEGIDMALDFEFRSVTFFQEMARIIEDSDDRASVEELERQERAHVAMLYEMKGKLQNTVPGS
ncbi:MAG: ferritin family protein [Deltaproteobacteria bacterium]|nr:ferritin family protein [Deltaproteobacteria bacterium]